MKVAVITSRFPYPVEKGDKLRAYQHIRHLAKDHDVHLFALSHGPVSEEAIAALNQYCQSVHIFKLRRWLLPLNLLRGLINGTPAQVSYFYDPTVKRRLQTALIQTQPRQVFTQLIRTAEYVRKLPFVKILDYMDTFSYGARQRSKSGALLMRPFFLLDHRLLKVYEKAVYSDFDAHTVISEQDRDRLPLAYQKSVTILPNGVDTGYFSPLDTLPTYDVAFVGNMGYQPNIEAAEFLVKGIMPEVWKSNPETTVCIVGARPHRRVRRLASSKVKVTGWVEDIRAYYADARIFVAPMLSGMGLQNKLLEAMAMARPCITTSIVNNAIGASHGTHVIVADRAREIAAGINSLMQNPLQCETLGQQARKFVVDQYAWSAQNKILDQLINRHSHQRNPLHGNTDRQQQSHVKLNS